MKIIGITGGIGSGKSTISDYFKKKGYPMHDSDAVVSEIYKKPNNSFLKLLHNSTNCCMHVYLTLDALLL